MSPAKKTSENKDYCKRYREKNREKYRKNDAERKRAQRVKVKLQNPELYELKKKEERERKQLSRLRKKFGLINQSPVYRNRPLLLLTTMLPHHRHLSQQSRQRLGVSVEQKKYYQRAQGRKTKFLVLWQKSINFVL